MKLSHKPDRQVFNLFNTVIEGGACASIENSPIKMTLDNYGRFPATLNTEVISVCPFSEVSFKEDEIGQELFGKNSTYMVKSYNSFYKKPLWKIILSGLNKFLKF
jgi:hypothetical protein